MAVARIALYSYLFSCGVKEERWLLHEPKGAESTVYGTAVDKMRMDRFRRSDACEDADYYERRLKEAGQ